MTMDVRDLLVAIAEAAERTIAGVTGQKGQVVVVFAAAEANGDVTVDACSSRPVGEMVALPLMADTMLESAIVHMRACGCKPCRRLLPTFEAARRDLSAALGGEATVEVGRPATRTGGGLH